MNKAQLIKEVEARLGVDGKRAQEAVNHVVDVIVRSVAKGERVAISGFGVFEKRRRGARTARNPKTGAAVKVKATSVPAFRPGSGFKEVVSGAKKLDKVVKATARSAAGAATRATGAAKTATKSAAKKSAAKKSAAKKTTATKAPARTSAAKKTAAAKTLASKSTPAQKKTPAAKTLAKKTTAKRTTAKKTAAKRG